MKILPLLSIVLVALVSSCGGGPVPISFSSNGSSAESGDLGVTGGGCRVATGEPVLFYGTLLENGRRDYTYLVIAKGLEVGSGEEFEQNQVGYALTESDRLLTQNSLNVYGFQLSAEFIAGLRDGAVFTRSLTVCGEPVTGGEWLFLVDGARPGAKPEAYFTFRPELPRDVERLDAFTQDVFRDLAASDPNVKAFLAR